MPSRYQLQSRRTYSIAIIVIGLIVTLGFSDAKRNGRNRVEAAVKLRLVAAE